MGKIYIKMRHDSEMNMDIPHNYNFANAMYGFREMGAEIVPYYKVADIYDLVTKEDIVIDYIDQCNRIFSKFDVYPHVPDYPKCLSEFLGRKIWYDTIDSISSCEEKWSAGNFVKPTKSKVFTGKIIKSIGDLVGCGNHSENYEVMVSESLDIKAEWRCFIYYDNILDIRPYGLLLDQKRDSFYYHYDSAVVKKMLDKFVTWDDRPVACSMDICVTNDNRTLLMELNDAYSLGSYGLPSIFYAKFISARWSQLLDRTDEFCF